MYKDHSVHNDGLLHAYNGDTQTNIKVIEMTIKDKYKVDTHKKKKQRAFHRLLFPLLVVFLKSAFNKLQQVKGK